MKHHIKLIYNDDGVLTPVDGEFDKNLIDVGDICVFSIPDNTDITCIAALDENAVCADCVFDNSEYTCSGTDSFRCTRLGTSRNTGISYVPTDMILEDL